MFNAKTSGLVLLLIIASTAPAHRQVIFAAGEGFDDPPYDAEQCPCQILTAPIGMFGVNNTEFEPQSDPVVAMKYWSVEYKQGTPKAPAGAALTWQSRPHGGGDWSDLISSATGDDTQMAISVGDFDVRLKAVVNGKTTYSPKRELVICDYTSSMHLTLVPTLDWRKFSPTEVMNGCMSMKGGIDFANGSPQSTKINQGFIQSVTGSWGVKAQHVATLDWLKSAKPGDTAEFYDWIGLSGPGELTVNDAPLGRYLYDHQTGSRLGEPISAADNPGYSDPPTATAFNTEGTKQTAFVDYAIKDNLVWNSTFTVWLVYFNIETAQYVAIEQQDWKLSFDSADAGPWPAVPVGENSAPASRNPTDNTTSSDSYHSWSTHGPSITATFQP